MSSILRLMKHSPSTSDLWRVFVVLLVLNILDAASTAVLVSAYGTDVEANPLVRYTMDLYGIAGMFMLKFAVLSILAFVMTVIQYKYMEHRVAMVTHRSTWLVNVILAIIVINNFTLVAAAINT